MGENEEPSMTSLEAAARTAVHHCPRLRDLARGLRVSRPLALRCPLLRNFCPLSPFMGTTRLLREMADLREE
jgi:hypothetical protein